MSATQQKLWLAIQRLRHGGEKVTYRGGVGIAALFDVGPLRKIGYYEILRQAEKHAEVHFERRDRSMIPLKEWPALSSGAFKSRGAR